jgi:hypothetical protein
MGVTYVDSFGRSGVHEIADDNNSCRCQVTRGLLSTTSVVNARLRLESQELRTEGKSHQNREPVRFWPMVDTGNRQECYATARHGVSFLWLPAAWLSPHQHRDAIFGAVSRGPGHRCLEIKMYSRSQNRIYESDCALARPALRDRRNKFLHPITMSRHQGSKFCALLFRAVRARTSR